MTDFNKKDLNILKHLLLNQKHNLNVNIEYYTKAFNRDPMFIGGLLIMEYSTMIDDLIKKVETLLNE